MKTMTMTQADLIVAIAERTGLTQADVDRVLDGLRDEIYFALDRDTAMTIPGIGKLSVIDVAARKGTNPTTGESIQIPAGQRIRFKPSASLKREVTP